ncbi:TetR/AcrR family transcriptional regulator [Microbacterium sp. NPDC089698]|uniref:TetR/AcrR family transcriptional regulator n=1 Tax=Microbacterium sp. NPDC089698 TaxID=3364200 RepID=UPI0037F6D2B3
MAIPRLTREQKVETTRIAILDAAERLYAEHGIGAVSNRQISEAAGQGNNTAVGYHFGTKIDLLQAIVQRHQEDVEARRGILVADAGDSSDVRVWVDCLVRPTADHLASLGSPTWYARLSAQLVADPALRGLFGPNARSTPAALLSVLRALDQCRPDLPQTVREQRDAMSRQLITYGYAEREEALAVGRPAALRHSWEVFTTGLVDAITGLWLAPWTPVD